MKKTVIASFCAYVSIISAQQLSAQIDYSTQVQPIFTSNCTGGNCHDANEPARGLDLTEGVSYGNIVNVASDQRPSEVRVKPESPNESYLYRKLINSDIDGQPMPRGSFPMDSTLVNTIRDWITQGALVTVLRTIPQVYLLRLN